jgi:branched-chain amino acid transport system substrate-binding protein
MKNLFPLLGILAILFIAGCTQPSQPGPSPGGGGAPTETIKIGFIAPLTGDGAIYGESSRGGVQLAVDEINAEGGVNGKQLEVVYEDGKCEGKSGATAANKLINVDKVVVIVGTVCSAETLGAAPIAEASKVVLLSAASSNPKITDAGDYIFRTWPSDNFQGNDMANYLYTTRGFRKVATIYQNSDYNIGLANAFKAAFEALGGQVVAAEVYEPTAKDFRTQLAKLKDAAPDAIFMVPYTAEAGLLVKQTRELGISLPLFGPETFGAQDVIDSGGESVEGVIYTTPKFDEKDPLTAGFIADYKAKFGKDSPFYVISANSYDGVRIVADCMRTDGVSSEAIKACLYEVSAYPGTAGELTIDSNGDALKSFQFMQIKDGKLEPLA